MRATEKIISPIHQRLSSDRECRILDEDWDNLLLLDACRIDLFKEVIESAPIKGELSTRYSSGSGSVEYLKSNFQGEDCRDIIYVTSNPFVKTEIDTPFHAVKHVWTDGWNEELGTVHPETMVEAAKDAIQEHPSKRLIVHFMQPHYPFIGDVVVDSVDLSILRSKAQNKSTENQGGNDVWARLANKEVTEDQVWAAYRSNLELVLDSVTDLINDIDGLSILTSDHGNAFGERAWPIPIKIYGHPNGVHIDSLRVVPWFECRSKNRREITVGKKTESSVIDEDINNRLKSLGYK